MKKASFIAAGLTLIILLLGITAAGAKASWTLENNVLTVSGTGDLSNDTSWNRNEVKKIVLLDGITGIGYRCFEGFSNLTEVIIPDSVTGIYEHAFEGCFNLTTITIPSSVKAISSDAFHSGIIMTVDRDSYAQKFAEKCGFTYVIRGEEKEQRTGATTVEEKIKEIIANEITDDMSDYRKAVVLHNWLIRNCTYDKSYISPLFSMYDLGVRALMQGRAKCEGYTLAYGMLLSAVGIENRYAYGTDHMWNVVKLDGSWCHVDVTWDDSDYITPHTYFAITDAALKGLLYHENDRASVVCNNYKMSQAYRSGKLERISWDWVIKITNHYMNGEFSFETDPLYYYSAYGVNERMAAEMLQAEGIMVGKEHISLRVELLDHSDNKYILKVRIIDDYLGDVNGDKVIDGRDAIHLMKYLAGEVDEETGEPIAIDMGKADLNGDGEVNELDLLQLMKLLAEA